MPGKNLPILIPQLRGGEPYDRYLAALLAAANSRGHPVANRTQLAELALNRLGATWGIKAPRRARPVGANQHGEPQAK